MIYSFELWKFSNKKYCLQKFIQKNFLLSTFIKKGLRRFIKSLPNLTEILTPIHFFISTATKVFMYQVWHLRSEAILVSIFLSSVYSI
jgi:hypothetical protein